MKKEEEITKPAEEKSAATADAKQPKQHWLTRATHFLVNFVGIGWVLNAIISVEIFKAIKKYKPHYLTRSYEVTEKLINGIIKSSDRIPRNPSTIPMMSKDLVDIIALGTGGFLVLPLQKLYAAHRQHIAHAVEKIVQGVKGLFGQTPDTDKPDTNNENTAKQKESVESISHWIASRVLAFTTSISIYMILKYSAKDSYGKMSKAVTTQLKKYLPKRFAPNANTTEYYIAEQITTVAGVSTLAIAKTGLDKLFPPKEKNFVEKTHHSANQRKTIVAGEPKNFRERTEIKDTGTSLAPS